MSRSPTVLALYRVSYLWTASIGWLIVMVLGSLVSLVTGPDNPLNSKLAVFSPPVAALVRRTRPSPDAAAAAASTDTLAEKATRL